MFAATSETTRLRCCHRTIVGAFISDADGAHRPRIFYLLSIKNKPHLKKISKLCCALRVLTSCTMGTNTSACCTLKALSAARLLQLSVFFLTLSRAVTHTHTNHLLHKTRFLLSPTRVQQGVLHWVQLSSWKALVSPDVRHAGSQMSAFMSGVQSFVATTHRDVPPAPSIFKNFTGPLYFFLSTHMSSDGFPLHPQPRSSPRHTGELGLSARMATSPAPLSPSGLTSHLSKIIYAVQGPPPCESVR